MTLDELAALYVELYNRLIGYFARRASGHAEDMTQEVFVRATRSLATYRPLEGVDPTAWIWRVAKSVLADHYRPKTNKARGVEIWSVEAMSSELGYTLNYGVIDRKIDLDAALATLTDAQRAVLVKHYLEGYEWSELSPTQSECGPKKMGHRGLAQLRKRKEMVA